MSLSDMWDRVRWSFEDHARIWFGILGVLVAAVVVIVGVKALHNNNPAPVASNPTPSASGPYALPGNAQPTGDCKDQIQAVSDFTDKNTHKQVDADKALTQKYGELVSKATDTCGSSGQQNAWYTYTSTSLAAWQLKK